MGQKGRYTGIFFTWPRVMRCKVQCQLKTSLFNTETSITCYIIITCAAVVNYFSPFIDDINQEIYTACTAAVRCIFRTLSMLRSMCRVKGGLHKEFQSHLVCTVRIQTCQTCEEEYVDETSKTVSIR